MVAPAVARAAPDEECRARPGEADLPAATWSTRGSGGGVDAGQVEAWPAVARTSPMRDVEGPDGRPPRCAATSSATTSPMRSTGSGTRPPAGLVTAWRSASVPWSWSAMCCRASGVSGAEAVEQPVLDGDDPAVLAGGRLGDPGDLHQPVDPTHRLEAGRGHEDHVGRGVDHGLAGDRRERLVEAHGRAGVGGADRLDHGVGPEPGPPIRCTPAWPRMYRKATWARPRCRAARP